MCPASDKGSLLIRYSASQHLLLRVRGSSRVPERYVKAEVSSWCLGDRKQRTVN